MFMLSGFLGSRSRRLYFVARMLPWTKGSAFNSSGSICTMLLNFVVLSQCLKHWHLFIVLEIVLKRFALADLYN